MNDRRPCQQRDVVVDSLLCYVINKRQRINDEELKNLIVNHFTETEIESAYDTLTKHSNFLINNHRRGGVGRRTNDGDTESSSKIDSILQIFDLCEENEWNLPRFAAVDLNNLPTDLDGQTPTSNDRDLLSRILHELKLVKRMVERFGGECREKCQGISSIGVDASLENMQTPSPLTDDTRGAVNVTVASSSPAPSSDDPSPTDSVCRRSTVGVYRKRGNSRGISSIEDAVAKLKAIRSDSVQPPSAVAPFHNDTSPEHGDEEMEKEDVGVGCDQDAVADFLQMNPFNFFAGRTTIPNSLCSNVTVPSVGGLPPPVPIPFGVPSTNFLRPSYLDVLAPFVTPSSTAVVNVDSSLAVTPSTSSPRTSASHRSCSSLKSSYPSVQKLPKQNRVNSLLSHSTAVPSSNGNVACKSEPTDVVNNSGANSSLLQVAGDNNDSTYKPYVCQHANCHKRFANKFLLKKHEFIHTGERPHQCTYCCKRFNRKDNLLRHKKTHEANYSLVRRRSRHLFGVGVGGGTSGQEECIDDADCDGQQRPVSCSLPAMTNNESLMMTTASSDSGGASISPSTPHDKFMKDSSSSSTIMNNNSSKTTIFAFDQQMQFAAALNAYKASGLAAALWSHAGVSSSDN